MGVFFFMQTGHVLTTCSCWVQHLFGCWYAVLLLERDVWADLFYINQLVRGVGSLSIGADVLSPVIIGMIYQKLYVTLQTFYLKLWESWLIETKGRLHTASWDTTHSAMLVWRTPNVVQSKDFANYRLCIRKSTQILRILFVS